MLTILFLETYNFFEEVNRAHAPVYEAITNGCLAVIAVTKTASLFDDFDVL